jgi:acyl-coenzyme A thioesterase PaaI-like protein
MTAKSTTGKPAHLPDNPWVTAESRLDRFLFRIINIYPPFVGAGIHVLHRRSDPFTVVVRLRQYPWNRNAFGTHFGGSLYAMCDPFFCLIVLRHLGRSYSVWDTKATIEFLRPGRGTVEAAFHVPPSAIDDIRRRADAGEIVQPAFTAEIRDARGSVVARLEKTLYVRKKTERPRAQSAPRPSGSPES